MSFWGLAQLVISTVIFLLAAVAAKQWGLAPSLGKILRHWRSIRRAI